MKRLLQIHVQENNPHPVGDQWQRSRLIFKAAALTALLYDMCETRKGYICKRGGTRRLRNAHLKRYAQLKSIQTNKAKRSSQGPTYLRKRRKARLARAALGPLDLKWKPWLLALKSRSLILQSWTLRPVDPKPYILNFKRLLIAISEQ